MPPSRTSCRSRSQGKRKRSKAPKATSTSPSATSSPAPKRAPRRLVTLYDVVAGRVTPHGFIDAPSAITPSEYRDIPSHGASKILNPDEALSMQAGAPERVYEDDWYTAHRHLVDTEEQAEQVRRDIRTFAKWPMSKKAGKARRSRTGGQGTVSEADIQTAQAKVKIGRLPNGELLEAVHNFTSRFYEVHGGQGDWLSMDETALLAMGVLLEETVRSQLGETGDLVFVEGRSESEEYVAEDPSQEVQQQQQEVGPEKEESHGQRTKDASDAPPESKRRKLDVTHRWGKDR